MYDDKRPVSPALQADRSAALICFMPDYGHVQPLLRVADALRQSGFRIRCYVAAECTPLLSRFPAETTYLEKMDLVQAKKAAAETFSRGIFYNRYSGYAEANVYGIPQVMLAASRSAEALKESIAKQKPDVVIADGHLFNDWYGRMAEAVRAPIIFNQLDGNSAGTQTEYVQAYGFTDVSPLAQRAVEKAGAVFSRTYPIFYRLNSAPRRLSRARDQARRYTRLRGMFPDANRPEEDHRVNLRRQRQDRAGLPRREFWSGRDGARLRSYSLSFFVTCA